MTQTKLPHFRIRTNKAGVAIGRWEATAAMRAHGFKTQTLGPDCDRARAIAKRWNAQWDIARRGHKASDELIAAAGHAHDKADQVRAHATLDHIYMRTLPFVNSSAARYLAKGMRDIARELERAAESARANATLRDVLHVASA